MIVVVTLCGNTMEPGTHADLMASALFDRSAHYVTDCGNGDMCDRLNGTIATSLQLPNVTHIGLAEADMRFPHDAFPRLVSRKRDIVGANYWQRTQRKWTASLGPNNYITSEGKTGLERVLGIACGVMLIDAKVFRGLPMPWFTRPYIPDIGQHVGPDMFFCTNAGANGYEVWVDHDLSQQVEHIGQVRFGASGTKYASTTESL